MTNTSQILKLFTSNVNTCRDGKTRSGILDTLKNHEPDIWMMQEVNVNTEELSSIVESLGYIYLSITKLYIQQRTADP